MTRPIRLLAVLTGCLFMAFVQQASAQLPYDALKRMGVEENSNLDIDGIDDERVDVDVAVLDSGIDLEDADLEVVEGADCLGAVAPTYLCETEGSDDGDDTVAPFHGTQVARGIAALDNTVGSVGVVPGARLWAVDVVDENTFADLEEAQEQYELGQPWTNPAIDMDAMIAGVKWVTAHADEIEVANYSIPCTTDPDPPMPTPVCSSEDAAALEAAISESIEAGVVYVTPAGNWGNNVQPDMVPARHLDLITVSAVIDTDGEPGGIGPSIEPCGPSDEDLNPGEDPDDIEDPDLDDTNGDGSGWGTAIDIAAPVRGCTTGASALVSGAAAVLASMDNPDDGIDVSIIRSTLVGEGTDDWVNTAPFNADKLLNISDSAIFDPATAAVDSDVTGDGRGDLVTLRANGVAYVHPGAADAKFGAGAASFGGDPLDPAQYDGAGHYAIDISDVDGDKRADLITLSDDGDVHVFRSEGGGALDPDDAVSQLGLTPALLSEGGHEPIAVADINGDTHGDLISYDDQGDDVMVYRGHADLTFGPGVVARAGISSALHTQAGHYFVDAGDVTGDGRADLVTMTSTDDLNVFAGRSDGTLAAAVVSHQGAVDPAMADGAGYEPVGLGDVTGDVKADVVLVKAGVSYTYPGTSEGAFGEPEASYTDGALTSNTFGSGNFELVGVLDVTGDGHADIAGTLANTSVRVGTGQPDGTFAGGTASSGTFPSTQKYQNSNPANNEFVFEKPSVRRVGCPAQGCFPPGDNVGLWRQATNMWLLRNWGGIASVAGAPSFGYFVYGVSGEPQLDLPVVGDWDGDGDDTAGVWRREGNWATFMLRNSHSAGEPDQVVPWGGDEAPYNDLPVVGDWDGDGVDTVGLWRPSIGYWLLCNDHSSCAGDYTAIPWTVPGGSGNDVPVVGDWDGDGDDTIGFWRGNIGAWYQCNDHSGCPNTVTVQWGDARSPHFDIPVVGDWDDDGDDTAGVWRKGNAQWYLCNVQSSCSTNHLSVGWGNAASPAYDLPVAGNWIGD